jgi:transposase InsO family protein
LGLRQSAYYKSKQKPGKRELQDEKLLDKIKKVFVHSKETYGSPRVEQELRKINIKTSKKRVGRLMNEANLVSRRHRKFKATTNSNHNLPVAENLLAQNFTATRPLEVVTSDITYIPTKEGWMYLSIVLDVFNREIISWKTDNTLRKELVYEIIEKSLAKKKQDEEMIFHSDRGVQYASSDVRNLLKRKNVKQSMSRKGNCYDNAITETFFKTLKTELIYHWVYETRKEAESEIFEYIELFYNRNRIHSSLGYKTPKEFKNEYLLSNK